MAARSSDTQAAKRKKMEDMDESPPKRVTRARTAKAPTNVEPVSKPAKATKAPAAVAREKKKVPAKASTDPNKAPATKRKTRRDENEQELGDGVAPTPDTANEPKSKPTTSRSSRTKPTVSEDAVIEEVIEAPKPRGRPAKAASTKNTKATENPSRSKACTGKIEEPTVEAQAAEPPKKATRKQAAAKVDSTVPKITTRARTTKKVQFQDEPDKENIPMETSGSKKTAKSAMKPTGIRAKPVRKAVATRATTRGRKTAKDQVEEKLPLSPKKVNQVAKAGSTSSEDELAGDKTPIASPAKSPNKAQTSTLRVMNVIAAPASPSKSFSASSILSSPARRPPASPFKDGLKMSPKKVDIDFSNEVSIFQATLNKTPAKSSLLQESPKKMILHESIARPILLGPSSPSKSSLLQSPARRPMNSPFKNAKTRDDNISKADSHTLLRSPSKSARFGLEQAASSPFKAARSPERAPPVHKITPKAHGTPLVFQIPSPGMADSPEKPVVGDPVVAEGLVDANADTTMQDVEEAITDKLQEAPRDTSSSTNMMTYEESRRVSMESGSTDELASPDKRYAPTPLRKDGRLSQVFGTPTTLARAATHGPFDGVSFTPLVGKMNNWSASSPIRREQPTTARHRRGVFSLGGAAAAALNEESPFKLTSPAKTSFFEDELAVMDEFSKTADESDEIAAENIADSEAAQTAMQTSMESQASEEYGDENTAPTEAEMLREEQETGVVRTCTPAKVFDLAKTTPAKPIARRPEEVHTVSKVPLRASAEDFAQKSNRQRSKSMGGFLSTHGPTVSTKATEVETLPAQPETPKLPATEILQTPSSGLRLDPETPGRATSKSIVPDVLKGAIVYVDVHTAEGADASSIFVDLLSQMGARCVKQWNWNPRTSMVSPHNDTASPTDGSPSTSPATGRVGITHVVYKDGGQRTLQKVRQSSGVVSCVGVGWVLE